MKKLYLLQPYISHHVYSGGWVRKRTFKYSNFSVFTIHVRASAKAYKMFVSDYIQLEEASKIILYRGYFGGFKRLGWNMLYMLLIFR